MTIALNALRGDLMYRQLIQCARGVHKPKFLPTIDDLWVPTGTIRLLLA